MSQKHSSEILPASSDQGQPAPAYEENREIQYLSSDKGSVTSSSDRHRRELEALRNQPRGTTGEATVENYVSEKEKAARAGHYEFKWKSLYRPAVVNPINGKSHTFPLLRFWDSYSTAFWLATLGFFVAFFGWFAAAGLMTEAIKGDLKLTADQVTNSNLASLGGTAIVRIFSGYFVDRYGPRKVMAVLLVIGAIPTGLMPLVKGIDGLYAIRFFISLLGGTFVPCQAWTTTFFDKNIVGTANAFSGGWGNMGGGVTTSVMIGLYTRLRDSGLTSHLAWRVCFVIVPVPLLLLSSAVILLLGKDHPAGKWSQRHQLAGTAYEVAAGREVHLDRSEIAEQERMRAQAGGEHGHGQDSSTSSNEKMLTSAAPAKTSDFSELQPGQQLAQIDTAVAEPLTLKTAGRVLMDLRVWMVAVSYGLSFGLETALDAALPQLIYALFASPSFTAESAAFAASTYGLMNLFFRPMGGVFSDMLYHKFRPRGYGLRAKVTLMLVTNVFQGLFMLGLGLYVNKSAAPTLGVVMGFIVLMAATGFVANAAAYSVYGHLRPKNIGFCAGLIGNFGPLGGICYTLIFKSYPGVRAQRTLGKKFVVAGIVNAVGMAAFAWVPLGDAA